MADSLALREFVHIGITESAPDHSTASRTRLRTLLRRGWVVYAKYPFGGTERALRYFTTCTHRVKGKHFENLEEGQAYLDHCEEGWANTGIHGYTKRQVATMFTEEKPLLKSLPSEPFCYNQ